MRRIVGAIAGLAGFLFLVGCTHVPLLIAGMDAEDIRRVSDEMLCNSSAVFMHTRGRRFPNIETEIDRRGLPCGDNETQVAAVAESAPAPLVTMETSGGTTSRALQNANMRGGPGSNHPVVGVLRAGETVTVLRVVAGWCECMSGARRMVFVRCSLLAPPPGGWPSPSSRGRRR